MHSYGGLFVCGCILTRQIAQDTELGRCTRMDRNKLILVGLYTWLGEHLLLYIILKDNYNH